MYPQIQTVQYCVTNQSPLKTLRLDGFDEAMLASHAAESVQVAAASFTACNV
jgi:hypothetical protein